MLTRSTPITWGCGRSAGASGFLLEDKAVGRGLSSADMARELYVRLPTVKAHVSRLLVGSRSTTRL